MDTIAVFTHDGPICKDADGIYCSVTITDEMLSRYLVFADELIVITRVRKIEHGYKKANLKPIFSSHVKIIEVENFLTPTGYFRKARNKKMITTVVAESSLFFLRVNSVLSDMVARECVKQKKPYMAEVGGCAWDGYWNHGASGKILAPLMFLNSKKTVKEASHVSYVTKYWLQRRYPTKHSSICASNVYLTERIQSVEDVTKRANGWNIKKVFSIGTIGNVDVRYKGQQYVIKAIASLRKLGIDCRYELVGNGDPSFLKKLVHKYKIDDYVAFKGVINHDDIPAWLSTLDLYIQPSKQEGLPRSLIEAMNEGCVCLGSTTAGIPELIDSDLLFRANDWKKIASLIRYLISSDEESIKKRINSTYTKSKEYNVTILNKRRNLFYEDYFNYAMKHL